MQILTCEQRSVEWYAARCGRPTASGFCNIVTATGKPRTGAARTAYLHDLVGDAVAGSPGDQFDTYAMQRGRELEPAAREAYELHTCREVQEVGFCLSDDGLYGASPDGLVGEDGGLEIKCPQRRNMVAYLLQDRPVEAHYIQVQGCMWVTGRQWWDYWVYSPEGEFPCGLWRIEPDAAVQDALAKYVPQFCQEVAETVEKIYQRGVVDKKVAPKAKPEVVRGRIPVEKVKELEAMYHRLNCGDDAFLVEKIHRRGV